MVKGLYTQKILSGYDKWFWNHDIFSFQKSPPPPKILNLWLFLLNFTIKIIEKGIKNPLFYWISNSLMILGFSEWHLDFPKMLPTQGFWLPKGVPFFRIFLLGRISDAYRFRGSHVNYLIFYFLLVFRFIHIFSFQYLSWCDFDIISSRKWPKIQILEVFSIFRQPLWIFWKLWKTHFEYFVYIFWSFFDLLNLRALSKVEKRLLTLEIWNLATLVVKFLSSCHLQIVLTST